MYEFCAKMYLRLSLSTLRNIRFIDLFLPIWQKTASLSSLVEARIGKDSSVMDSTWPAYICINKTASMVDSPMQNNGVPAFPVVVIGWTLLWRDDRDIRSIDCSHTLGKTEVILETVYDLSQSSSSRKTYVPWQ